MPKKLTTEIVIKQFIDKHGNRYDYSLVNYVNTDEEVKIICKEHGIFEQKPHKHKIGQGCKDCQYVEKNSDTHIFIKKAIKMHGTKYNYSLVKYTKAIDKVIILCNKCNEPFEQTPNSHLRKPNGRGCPTCNTGNDLHDAKYYKNKKTTLYYIKIDNVYKIGVTLQTIKSRYRDDKNVKIEILKEWVFEDGSIAINYEQAIIKYYKKYKYNGEKILKGGNTELFNKNILPLFEDKIIV